MKHRNFMVSFFSCETIAHQFQLNSLMIVSSPEKFLVKTSSYDAMDTSKN